MKKAMLFPLLVIMGFFLFLWAVTGSFGFFGTNYFAPGKATPKADISSPVAELPKTITLLHNGTVLSLDLEEYLYGVVAGEMPASFETEALKAQAVAARTYTVNRSRYQNPDHPEANVCSNSAHCKAYLPPEELTQKFQSDPALLQKIKDSVDATKSEIILYNGEPIFAVFHSTSSGMTENSKDVWGGDVPYLQSVVSEGEEASPRFSQTLTFSLEEFCAKINAGDKKVTFSEHPEEWFSNWETNESGSIRTVSVCGTSFKGTELRSLLGLRSTNFTVTAGDSIIITTKGNGHGVGMSQYGANDMAKRGYAYTDILKKYYTGVEIANR